MLDKEIARKIIALTKALINQRKAKIIVSTTEDEPGYWFGGGNMIAENDGTLYLVGRYRSSGDARTGTGKGVRGHELAVFRSDDNGDSFEKIVSFGKGDLTLEGKRAISIEGAALHIGLDTFELFVSAERDGIDYPSGLEEFKKPGTGVWTIDKMEAPTIEELKSASLKSFFTSNNPEHLHVKDPVIHATASGDNMLIFCTHPFSWSSTNSAYCIRPAGSKDFCKPIFDFFPRGTTWDVAVSRISDVLSLPKDLLDIKGGIQVVFYDGAECIRKHSQDPNAVLRPRGYSCEEIGGLAAYSNENIEDLDRISKIQPMFISPWGTGCSRYIHTCLTKDRIFATWQQSQNSGAQPLVMNALTMEEAETIFSEA
jgi:hypothetical protein